MTATIVAGYQITQMGSGRWAVADWTGAKFVPRFAHFADSFAAAAAWANERPLDTTCHTTGRDLNRCLCGAC